MATFNFAVDAVDEKPGLPKALAPMRQYFDYLVQQQYRYGYTVFFNMNICRNNMDDIKAVDRDRPRQRHRHRLPHQRIAHDRAAALQAYGREQYVHHARRFRQVDELVDWLKDKNRPGYKMVNSVQRLNDMSHFMRGKVEPWNCRAGQNNVIIRVDGTLAPCFPMYSATYDWGVIEKHKFEKCRNSTR